MTSAATPQGVVDTFDGDVGRPDVWLFDRTTPEFMRLAERGPTSDEERVRSERFKDPAAGVGLLSRRAAVRRVLGLYLARPPDAVRIVTLPGGKPTFVPESGDRWRLSYSTGHSGDLFCMTVATAESIGVDIERMREVPRALPIAVRWFSHDESSRLRDAGDDRFSEEFLRLWTAKEALAKRHSAGLRLMGGGAGDLDVHWEVAKDHLIHFESREGYVASLASTAAIVDVRVISEPTTLL